MQDRAVALKFQQQEEQLQREAYERIKADEAMAKALEDPAAAQLQADMAMALQLQEELNSGPSDAMARERARVL
eukprot:322937-Rhodomonas_salina.1